MCGWIRRISDFKFIVKNIPMSPSPSVTVTKKNKPSQMISSGDCAKNPLSGLQKKKNHHCDQVLEIEKMMLEIEKKKEGCRPQVKSSVIKGSSSSSSVVNLKEKPPLVRNSSAKIDGFKSVKMHQGPSAMNSSTTAKATKTVSMSMNSSSAKANKTVNALPRRKSDTSHCKTALLVRGKSNHLDSDSMQFKGNKASIFASKRPRNQGDDDNGTSALNFKRRRTTLTSSGVKPKPAESPQTICQTVVTSCRISKKAADVPSDASTVINILPADKQPKAVFKNAAAHSNSDREASPQDDDSDIPSIFDKDSCDKAKRRVEILTKFQQYMLKPIADPLEKEAKRQELTRKVKITEEKIRAYEKTMPAHISLEKVDKYSEARRAARIALEKVVKTVEFNDTNHGYMEELDRLINFNVRPFDLNFAPSAVQKPLERLGLYLKEDY